MTTGLVLDDTFLKHVTGGGHPERPERVAAITERLARDGLDRACRAIGLHEVEERWIQSNHSDEYLQRLYSKNAARTGYIDTAECPLSPATLEVARLAAGSALAAVDEVMSGNCANAFCAVRPPGHHAESHTAMGFCYFNNIAITARYLLEHHHLERVLILDWDVHHGNGTQHSFESDPRVFFCSMHGHPLALYPGTGFPEERGKGPGAGYTLNLAMAPGSGDEQYRKAFEEQFMPRALEFDPQFVLVSAGFDAHRADPIGNCALESESFRWLTQGALHVAGKCCSGKLVSLLEGGYNLAALAESASIHVETLLAGV